MSENDTDRFGSVVPGFKIRGMEPERNVYGFLITVDVDFAEELRSLDVPEKQEGAAEHISGALSHDMADVRFVGDSFLLRGITVGFQATGLDLHKEERGRQQFATHNVDTSGEAMEVIAAFSRWEDLASYLLEDRREDDGLRADGGTDHYRRGDEIPPQCQLCQPLGYRGDFINEPEGMVEVARDDGGTKIVHCCERCADELFTSPGFTRYDRDLHTGTDR